MSYTKYSCLDVKNAIHHVLIVHGSCSNLGREVMQPVLHFRRSVARIGLLVRRGTPGPERLLVQRFVRQVRREYSKTSRHLAVFQEPSLATGNPDVVIAEYNPRIFDNWSPRRSTLGQDDLKVLHYIFHVQGASSPDLEHQLGVRGSRLLQTIETLLEMMSL